MVNYTLGDGFKKMMEFEVKHTTGDICISGTLDYETRSSYEFPIIATDQGNILQSNHIHSILKEIFEKLCYK